MSIINRSCPNCQEVDCVCHEYDYCDCFLDECICVKNRYYKKHEYSGYKLIKSFQKYLFKENNDFVLSFQKILKDINLNYSKYFEDWLYTNIFPFSTDFSEYKNEKLGYLNFMYIYNVINLYVNTENKMIVNNFSAEFMSSYFLQRNKKKTLLLEKELIEKTWHPVRFFDWCLSIDEKEDIK